MDITAMLQNTIDDMVQPGRGILAAAWAQRIVPGINFLSGGQAPEEATANLNAINQQAANIPWQLSISYGRALQQPALQTWQGKVENIQAAQAALLKRARLNHLAMLGEYVKAMEEAG